MKKVNHLAKIGLEDPVMIGLDNIKRQPDSSIYQTGSLGSNVDENLDCSSKFVSSLTGDELPTQLVQDTTGRLDDLMREFKARNKAEKRPASESSPSPSPAKKGKAGVCEGEPAWVVGYYVKLATPAEGIKISSGPTTKSAAECVDKIGYDWVEQHWPTLEVEALRQKRSTDTLKSGVALLAQAMSANLAAIASLEEELLLANGTKQAMEVINKEKEGLQTKLSVTERDLRIAEDKALQTCIVNQRLEHQLEETMARSTEETKKMNQEIAAVQAELEREKKESRELQAKLDKEQLWRDELLEQVDQQGICYRESALYEVQLKYGPLNLMEIPFEELRIAPEGFNVFNPTAEALEQQRSRGTNEDATASVGKNVDQAPLLDPASEVKPAVEELRPDVFNPFAEALEQQRNGMANEDVIADIGGEG